MSEIKEVNLKNNQVENDVEKSLSIFQKIVRKITSVIMILVIAVLLGIIFYFWHQNTLLKQENETLKETMQDLIDGAVGRNFEK